MLWLLGVEVLPNLHLALHDADHTHAADGTIIIARDAEQRERIEHLLAHADNAEHHHAPKQSKKPRQLAFTAADGIDVEGHTAAGLGHHATGLLAPPPPIVAPGSLPHVQTWRFEAPHVRIASTFSSRPTARGPPVA